jgi:tRNA A37 threonylcarbamoyladenosine dehydratase
MNPDYSLEYSSLEDPRFGGIARLYGRDGFRRLSEAHVCVVGVGGVGSWTVEALARSGVGMISLIDLDEVCITNVNRQLPAMSDTVGRAKVEVLAERVRLINPACQVFAEQEFFTQATAARFLSEPFDWVVDAIDVPVNKCLLLAECRQRGISVLTIGGAGGKREATGVRVADLGQSGHDPLLRVVRRDLRRVHGFACEPGKAMGIPCVFSAEAPVYPWADGRVCETREEGSALTMDCASGFGAATFVTGVFGFVAAGEIVRRIALEAASSEPTYVSRP